MADFHQEGTITALRDLYTVFDKNEYLKSLEEKLTKYSRRVKISLLLPCLYSELSRHDV